MILKQKLKKILAGFWDFFSLQNLGNFDEFYDFSNISKKMLSQKKIQIFHHHKKWEKNRTIFFLLKIILKWF